jgi:hypothetical protein
MPAAAATSNSTSPRSSTSTTYAGGVGDPDDVTKVALQAVPSHFRPPRRGDARVASNRMPVVGLEPTCFSSPGF